MEVVEALNSLGIGRNDRVAMVLPEGPETGRGVHRHRCRRHVRSVQSRLPQPLNSISISTDLDCKALLAPPGSTSPAVAVAKIRGIPILELTPLAEAEAGLFTLNRGVSAFLSEHLKPGFAQPDDFALALHTSGTTARPKLALLTHKNICASAYNIRGAVELRDSDRCLNVMPLFHIHGLSTIFASLAAGASVICPPSFSAAQFFEWMEALRPTWYTAAPTIHQAILKNVAQHPEIVARSGLRFIRSASSAMPPQLMADMERVFRVPFIEAYGMTEASPQIASNRLPPSRRKSGSVGPAAGPEVAIMDASDNLMPTGETGEIVIRGTNVIEAYENQPEANQSAFVRGWFRTGDLGHLDTDGYLFITGRLKEIINRGGEKISPREVDEVLLDHPAVAQAVTFAVPHPTLGEAVAAAIVPRGGASVTEAEIRQFAAERLAHFKVPQTVVIVDEIPKGSTGKVERIGLAERLGLVGPGGKQAKFTAPRTSVEERLTEIWASVLGIDPPGIHDNFFQSGGDSLAATQVVARLRHEFQVELPIESLFDKPTVAELAELVTQAHCLRPARDAVNAGTTIPQAEYDRALPTLLCPAATVVPRPDRARQPRLQLCRSLWLTGSSARPRWSRVSTRSGAATRLCAQPFPLVGEQPVQVISPAQPHQAAGGGPDEAPVVRPRDRSAASGRRGSRARPFDLAHGPLFRATLVRLSGEEHVLLLTDAPHRLRRLVHAQCCTGNLETLYERSGRADHRRCRSCRSSTPILPSGSESGSGERTLESQLAYWKKQLRSVPPVIELPTDRPRPALQTYRGSRRQMVIPRQVTEGLKALSLREEATLFMTLLAAFQTLLFRYTGQDDFLVGITDRQSDSSGDGGADRFLCEHAGSARQSVGRSDVPRAAAPGANDGHGRLYAPGPAVRETGGGAATRARSEPHALVPGDVRLPESSGRGSGPRDGAGDSRASGGCVNDRAAVRTCGGTYRASFQGQQRHREVRPDSVSIGDRAGAGVRHGNTTSTCSRQPRSSGSPATSRHCWKGSWPTPNGVSRSCRYLLRPSGTSWRSSGITRRRRLLLDRCFHHVFEEQVERTPDAVAVRVWRRTASPTAS